MRHLHHQLCILLLTAAPLVSAHAQPAAADADSALTRSNTYTLEMDAYETQLADLESRFGPYHRSLLEPLQGMTALATADADYDLVAELQTRQLQVMRTVFGFRNPELVPLMQAIIANEIRRQNWVEVADDLEHIRYLTANSADVETRLQSIRLQMDWQLLRVFLDDTDMRARNFMAARSLAEEMLKLAREHYPEHAPELIPWLYESALTNYRLVEMLNSDQGIASAVIERLVREDGAIRLQSNSAGVIDPASLFGSHTIIPIIDEGDLIGEAYLRDGMRTLEEIGEIAAQQGDLEGQAMAEIYEGDFQHIMGNGLAFRKYRDARDKLLAAGLAEDRIEAYFNTPMLIPAPRLFLTLEAALADQQQQRSLPAGAAGEAVSLGQLIAWDESVPNVPRPESAAALFALDLPYDQVDLTLSVSRSGRISGVEVVTAEPAERSIERKAWRAVRDIKVRPALVAGKAQRSRDVHIRFLSLAE